jgi:hypothetical protein
VEGMEVKSASRKHGVGDEGVEAAEAVYFF